MRSDSLPEVENLDDNEEGEDESTGEPSVEHVNNVKVVIASPNHG